MIFKARDARHEVSETPSVSRRDASRRWWPVEDEFHGSKGRGWEDGGGLGRRFVYVFIAGVDGHLSPFGLV